MSECACITPVPSIGLHRRDTMFRTKMDDERGYGNGSALQAALHIDGPQIPRRSRQKREALVSDVCVANTQGLAVVQAIKGKKSSEMGEGNQPEHSSKRAAHESTNDQTHIHPNQNDTNTTYHHTL